MEILSHRGCWKTETEKNAQQAFSRSFELGYGTELDVRDCAGELLVSHDMPRGDELRFYAVTEHPKITGLPLAINIKSDGLAKEIGKKFRENESDKWFVFDMSIPDTLSYIEEGIRFYTRMSEYERSPAFLEKASGVWLDGFESTWYKNEDIESLLHQGKRVCLVSPELHGRSPNELWEMLDPGLLGADLLQICTDLPQQADGTFSERMK